MTALAKMTSPADMPAEQLHDFIVDAKEREEAGARDLYAGLVAMHGRKAWGDLGFSTFSEYCQRGLKYSRAHAYRILQYLSAPPAGGALPDNEWQARQARKRARQTVNDSSAEDLEDRSKAAGRRSADKNRQASEADCLKICERLAEKIKRKARAHEPDIRARVIDVVLEELAKLADDLPFLDELKRLQIKAAQAA